MKRRKKNLKRKFVKHRTKNYCANCGLSVTGNYCNNCGQSTREMHQPFWQILMTFFGEALSVDGKLLRTLKLLVFKPWVLTQDFMNGKRICYTPPFRMYLFATFFAFLLLSINYSSKVDDATKNPTSIDTVQSKNSVADSLTNNNDASSFMEDIIKGYNAGYNDHPTYNESDKIESHTLKTLRKISKFADNQPLLFIDTILKKVSQALLILFPLFAFLLALFFYSSKRYLLEHLLISLNYHTFIFIIVIFTNLIFLLPVNLMGSYAVIIYLLIPIQLYRTLRNYYKQSRGLTVLKLIVLLVLYVFLLFSMLLVSFGLMLYSFW